MPLTRRRAFAAAGLAFVTACTSGRRPAHAPAADPDDALRASAVAREQALLVAYDEALASAPALAARIAPLRAEHATHVTALEGPESSPSPTPTTPTPGATPSAPTPSTPAEAPQSLLHGLAGLERTTAAAHATAALTASRRLAPVLASLAACEASHAVVL